MFPLRGVRPSLFTPMKLLCRQTRIPCFGRWQNVADTVANNVREQMDPLLVLLKQAQDHSEVLEQRCHGLGARQSVIQIKFLPDMLAAVPTFQLKILGLQMRL
jgi:hypothetical protein